MMDTKLEALLADLALIQGYLDVHRRSAPDDLRQTHVQSMISDARSVMLGRLRELSRFKPAELRISLAAFKDTVTNLMLTGLSPANVSFDTPTTLVFLNHFASFGASNREARYIYEFSEPIDVFAAQSLPGEQLFASLFSDVLQAAENPWNYSSDVSLYQNVFLKIVSLLYAIESSGGKFGWNEDEGGQENDAPVPRVPISPRLIGEAEEEIPDLAAKVVDAVWIG